MKCQYCKKDCVKIGKQKDGTQKFRCKGCSKYQQENYKYQAKVFVKRKLVSKMVINNAGFAGTARALSMAVNTVKKTVLKEAQDLKPPCMPVNGVYEIDEMRAYFKKGKPQIWAVYAIEKTTGKRIGISVGRRNLQTLRKTINAVLLTYPKRIYTDGYVVYKGIISKHLHKISKKMLCRIERSHLTARNSLKMLNRSTLAFVRKRETLLACLKLLFWS